MTGGAESADYDSFVQAQLLQLSQKAAFPVRKRSTGSRGLFTMVGYSSEKNSLFVSAEESLKRFLELTDVKDDFF